MRPAACCNSGPRSAHYGSCCRSTHTGAPRCGRPRLSAWAYGPDPDDVKYFNGWVKPYQDKGNTVNIEYVDWTTYWTKLPTQFSAGTAADVLEMSNYTLQFGPQGVLADLNPYLAANSDMKMDDFVAVPFEKFTYQGKLISFPMCLTIQAMAYNKDIFDKAKRAIPG